MPLIVIYILQQNVGSTVLPLTTKECPVPECMVKSDYDGDFVYHWKTYHVSQIEYYVCPKCDVLTTSTGELKDHYLQDHMLPGGANRQVPNNISNPRTAKLHNQLYISPGNLHLEKHVELNKSAPTDLVDITVQASSCPVPNCRNSGVKSAMDLRMHWRKCHIPVIKMYKCPMTSCGATLPTFIQSREHLLKLHSCTGERLSNLLKNIRAKEKMNKEFKDPGKYRYPHVAHGNFLSSQGAGNGAPSSPVPVGSGVSFDSILEKFKTDKPEPTVILMRGLPGAGKTRIARFMKVCV